MTRVSALVFGRSTLSNSTRAGSNDVEPRLGHDHGGGGGGGGGGPPYMSETNFDTNMVIILAALLCALICALGLNSIVRCALRCSRRVVFDSGDEVPVRVASTGIKRRTLRSLPVAVYTVGGGGESSNDCAICLAELSEGEKVRVLPNCNHVFHVKCVDTWLLSHSSCPTCRQSLLQNNSSCNSNCHPSLEVPPSFATDFSEISASTQQIQGPRLNSS